MKLKRIFLLIFAIILSACTSDDSINNPLIVGDDCIRPMGAIMTESRDLGNFTGIESAIPADIIITQGPVEPVRISAPSDILDELLTSVNNNTLNISFNECIEDLDNVSIFVTIPEIERLTLTGVGNVSTTEDIDVGELDISLIGVGNFNLKGTADALNIVLTGVGDIDAFAFNTDVCNINISGVGDAEVFVNDELNVIITGVGSVFYMGTPTVTSTITGDGAVIDVN